MIKTILFAISFSLLLTTACSKQIPHPPEYKHIKVFSNPDNWTFSDLGRLYAALQFTDQELQKLKDSGQLKLMVGGGIQSLPDDPLGTELLKMASLSEVTPGLAPVSLIDRYFKTRRDEDSKSHVDADLEASIKRVYKGAKDNALAHYLMAYLQIEKGNNTDALRHLKKGNSIKGFNSYTRERYLAIVDAAEFVGYSKYTARSHAFINLVPMSTYITIKDTCVDLISERDTVHVRKACYLAGKQIEAASGNFLETMIALSLQSIVIEGSSLPDAEKKLSKINRKLKELNGLREELIKIPPSSFTKDLELEYFRILIEKDEESAVRYVIEVVKQQTSRD